MIQLTRWRIREICDVFRASVWADGDNLPPVLIQAGPEGLTVSSQDGAFAVAYRQSGTFEPQAFGLPGKALEAVAGWSDRPVVLEPLPPGQCRVTWSTNGEGWSR